MGKYDQGLDCRIPFERAIWKHGLPFFSTRYAEPTKKYNAERKWTLETLPNIRTIIYEYYYGNVYPTNACMRKTKTSLLT